jgi:hypothetical protein
VNVARCFAGQEVLLVCMRKVASAQFPLILFGSGVGGGVKAPAATDSGIVILALGSAAQPPSSSRTVSGRCELGPP